MASLQEVLQELTGVSLSGDGYVARCPAHEDRVNSLSASEGNDGRVLLHCHAGCTKLAILHSLGKTMTWLYPDHGLQPGEHRPASAKRNPGERIVATFDYLDVDGSLLYQSLRIEWDDPEGGKPLKRFTQRKPNGHGGWSYSGVGEVKKVPYRLPEILKSHKSERVLIVEGERHADRLWEMGFVATCNVGGAGKWLKGFAQYFIGRDVVILPDNDEPGQKHAVKVTDGLKGSANSIQCLELPNLPPKGDVLDWIAAGGTKEQLAALMDTSTATANQLIESRNELKKREREEAIELARKRDPAATAFEKEILDQFGIIVFGEDDKGRIKVFSMFHRKTEIIRDINRLTTTDVLRLCGPVAKSFLNEGKEEREGVYRIADIKKSIATFAGFRRMGEQSEKGLGIWESRTDEAEFDSLIIVNAGEAAILNGSMHRHLSPQFGEDILDLSTSDPWFVYEELEEHIKNNSEQWSLNLLMESDELFGQWKYRDQEVTPQIITGMILATWVQTIWKWRPQVAISGQSDSGKTTMFGILAGQQNGERGIFRGLTIKSSDTSAAGIKQALSGSAKIVIVDELEAGKHRDDILQMLRGAGRGDKSLRGSAHHKAVDFELRHIVWTAATESGLSKEPDKNRFITIELIRPHDSEMGRMQIPSDFELQDFGQRMLALSVMVARPAKKLIEELKANRPTGFHNRIIESYAVPAACYATAARMTLEEAVELLTQMLMTRDASADVSEGDSDELLQAILGAPVMIDREQYSVSQVIVSRNGVLKHSGTSQSSPTDALNVLEGVGIAVERKSSQPTQIWIDDEEECIFIVNGQVKRRILKGTSFAQMNIGQLLLRIPGAVACKKRVAGIQQRGTLLPLSRIIKPDQ